MRALTMHRRDNAVGWVPYPPAAGRRPRLGVAPRSAPVMRRMRCSIFAIIVQRNAGTRSGLIWPLRPPMRGRKVADLESDVAMLKGVLAAGRAFVVGGGR